jgi:dTDP-glucose pyrophosphorylase
VLSVIDINRQGFCLVTNENNQVVGLITDGDARRSIIRDKSLDAVASSIMTTDFFFVEDSLSNSEILKQMKSRHIHQIPVLNSRKELTDIHFLNDVLNQEPLENTGVIMAGGFGTRLLPFTENLPKALVKVMGRPMIEHIIIDFVSNGIRNIVISIGHLGQKIKDYLGDGSKLGCSITYIEEKAPLGTCGALRNLPETVTYPIIVTNGDQITSVPLKKLLSFHSKLFVPMSMVVGTYTHKVPYGVVTVQDERLHDHIEKPSIQVEINRGMYVIERAAIELIPELVSFSMPELLDILVNRGDKIGVFQTDADWEDVGNPEDLLRVNGQL